MLKKLAMKVKLKSEQMVTFHHVILTSLLVSPPLPHFFTNENAALLLDSLQTLFIVWVGITHKTIL